MNIPGYLKDPRIFVPFWFADKALYIAGNLILGKSGDDFTCSQVFNGMWLDYRARVREVNANRTENTALVKGFPEKDLAKAFEEYFDVKRKEALDDIRSRLRFHNEDFSELRRYLRAMTGKEDDIELALLAHTVWQVKRKLYGQKVYDHMMVIIRGKQGSGKTEAMRLLFSVLKPWFKNVSLKEITDDRWKHFFKNTYVIFCDELQHAELADVDVLKNVITADELETRKLGHNQYDHVRQNSTFVGASNKSVAELIRDSSGMRRFMEILSLDKMDWNTINSIDYLKIWQGIDENREVPYIVPFRTEIESRQADLVVADPEEEFLSEFHLLDLFGSTRDQFMRNDHLYAVYQEWCKTNGEKSKTAIQFHKKIKNRGMKDYAGKIGHASAKGYWVNQPMKVSLTEYRVNAPVERILGPTDEVNPSQGSSNVA